MSSADIIGTLINFCLKFKEDESFLRGECPPPFLNEALPLTLELNTIVTYYSVYLSGTLGGRCLFVIIKHLLYHMHLLLLLIMVHSGRYGTTQLKPDTRF